MATTDKPLASASRLDQMAAEVMEPPKSPLARFGPWIVFVVLLLLFIPHQLFGNQDGLFLLLRLVAYGGALLIFFVPSFRGPLKAYLTAVIAVAIIDAHVYGWKEAQIDPALLVQKAPEMQRIMGQILSPDIITHDQFRMEVPVSIGGVAQPDANAQPQQFSQETVPVKIDTQGLPTSMTDTVTYNPSITAMPGVVAPGQEITVSGTGMRPNAEGEIKWQSTGLSASTQDLGGFKSDDKGDFTVIVRAPDDPERVVNASGFPNTLAVQQTYDIGGPQISPTVELVFKAMVQTIFVALLATTLAIIVALPISILASANLMSYNLFGKTVYVIARTVLNVLRAVEVLIWAIIFVAAVGIGPFAGMLALTVHSVASLGKLYSEAIEAIDPGPIEAITATGANRLQVIIYAVIPQFIPQFVSFTLYRWDINVRMATIIGLVGGGGIGLLLTQYIGNLAWQQAGTAILFIAIVVIAMDYLSAKIRAAVV